MQAVNYCFIVNPSAGGGFAGRNWPTLHEKLLATDIPHCHCLSEYRGHSGELARSAFDAGLRNFVVVGGDGTANEVLNGLLDAGAEATDVAIGIVPWGTGNDWASHYKLAPGPEDCVQLLQSGSCSLQDIGRVTFIDVTGNNRSRYFLNCAGTGFDSYLLQTMKTNRGGRFHYLLHVLKCLRKFRATPLQLAMDATHFESPAMLLEICLGKYAGAGMRFAPAAIADDGLFDILLIKDMRITQVLGSLVYLYNGRINRHWAVKSWRCRSISIASRAPQRLHCDGELLGQLPVEIEILPQALRVLVPTSPPPEG